uniref:NAC domain-containing protein n=3 Tax=Aegilops tauschii subsp. strangulata TaxID=200361 RepID=A0A453C7I9_AEGTS
PAPPRTLLSSRFSLPVPLSSFSPPSPSLPSRRGRAPAMASAAFNGSAIDSTAARCKLFISSLVTTVVAVIRNPTHPPPSHIECPNCKYHIDWPGLPAGVKFDPTGLELLEHLEGKVGRVPSHDLIDDFIPTIEEAEGICYTHPKNLPGTKMDGRNNHFFHKISNAYDVGQRKRRKISNSDHVVCDVHFRWHKTGKSKEILDNNGVIKGWKKILVLNMHSRKDGITSRTKTNWTMHQYHLGVDQDEKHGELVVSKVFYQPKKDEQPVMCHVNEESDPFAGEIDPTTPMTYPPQPRPANSSPSRTEQNQEEHAALSGPDERPSHGATPDSVYPKMQPFPLVLDALQGLPDPRTPPGFSHMASWFAGTSSHSNALEDAPLSGLDERLPHGGTLDAAYPDPEGQALPLDAEALQGFPNLGTPPDIFPQDLQFGSQDIFWGGGVLKQRRNEKRLVFLVM